jgi:inward rectifier potassium channel
MPQHSHLKHRRTLQVSGRDVVTYGLRSHFWQDLYYYTMTASWPLFFSAITVFFLAMNLVFASLYMLGQNPISNLSPNNFLGAFFFSVETLATVGYGDMHPNSIYAHWIATAEIFIGMIGIALVTGVMFARFSRPRSSIVFADHPVSHETSGRRVLMIRMANARINVISEASAKLRLLLDQHSPELGHFRKIYDLKLEREQHPIFVLGWTVIHVIDADSPLFGRDLTTLQQLNAALILSVEGVDETTNQHQRARQFYECGQIRWNHRYVDIFETRSDATQHIHYSRFHESEPLLPE